MSTLQGKPMDAMTEGHAFKRYDGELSHLHYLVLEMGGLVINQLSDAITAFKNRDVALAQKVVTRHSEVNGLEICADNAIMKLIAVRSPVSSDLRLAITVSKSVSDLERIGEEAAKIAGLTIQFFDQEFNTDPANQMLREVNRMGYLALTGLRHAVEVFDVWDEAKANHVIANYREMDEEFRAGLRHLLAYVLEDTSKISLAIRLVQVVKAFERIGHHSQNLAEHALFQVRGEYVQYQRP